MDCSWLVEDECKEDPGSESDSEETQAELEVRLYSIVHHSDLSQPLPPELAKHYSIQCGDDGKLTVVLNDSLENIRSDEIKKVDHFIKGSELNEESSEVVEIESSLNRDNVLISDNQFKTNKSLTKIIRYSDVNLDLDVPLNVNGTKKSWHGDINYSDINYFKITESFLKKKIKKLKDFIIPSSFQTGNSPDWKDVANESFISVGVDTSGSEKEIIGQMVCALKEANPKVNKTKLYYIARTLYFHNRKKYRKVLKRRGAKSKVVDKTLDSSCQAVGKTLDSSCEAESKFVDNMSSFTKHTKSNSVNIFDGSVSLNISPFKPMSQIVDLVSEDEVDLSNETAEKTIMKWNSLPKCDLPTKWTKKMTKFYTKPLKRKMQKEVNDIFEDLKKSTTVDDWRIDPRDQTGVYQRTPLKGKHRNRRCPNCHQHGHLMHECPSPRKVPCCFLCGLNYHTAYSCPNKICLKCGVYVTNEAYECSTCYYNTFNYDTPCGICGQVIHRTENCPDLWRSFHATVDGDKKIPHHVVENKRKYCCNCAAKGHFSHQCPFPSCEGEQISPFVTNYSASQCENGSTEIVVPNHLSHVIGDSDADRFLQKLSNSTKAIIDIEEGQTNFLFRISGTFDQCRIVRREIEEYMNTRKRKRQDPYPKKKRRKIR